MRPDSLASFQDAVSGMHAMESGQLHDRQASDSQASCPCAGGSQCHLLGVRIDYHHGGVFFHNLILTLFPILRS